MVKENPQKALVSLVAKQMIIGFFVVALQHKSSSMSMNLCSMSPLDILKVYDPLAIEAPLRASPYGHMAIGPMTFLS